jgi:hypothetical protein
MEAINKQTESALATFHQSQESRVRKVLSLLCATGAAHIAIRTFLLLGLIAAVVIMATTGRAFAQQNLHIVPSPFINNSTLNASVAIADNDIWAVGDVPGRRPSDEVPLAEHFNGRSWRVVATPSVPGGAFFSGVARIAGNDVWTIGGQMATASSSQPLIEHWDGTTWSVVQSPTLPQGGQLEAVTAVSSNDVWVAGFRDDFSGDVVEHWDGTSWTIVTSSVLTGNDILNGISADASNNVWVVGQDFATADAVILHWDGTTWSRLEEPGIASLNAVTTLSLTNAWTVGSKPGPPPGDIAAVIQHWDGTNWSTVSSPNPEPIRNLSRLAGIAAASASNIYAVGNGFNAPFTEHWNGTNWKLISTPSGVADLNAVTALSDGTAVAVGRGTNGSAVILEN